MASAHDFEFKAIDGRKLSMKDFAGKPVLMVNVASFCGLTPQYGDLQKLHETYGPRGLVVLGVPCNDFGAQEPKSEGEIAKFCETSYGVTFPMTSKEKVIGADAHGLYRWIAGQVGEAATPKWNFHKYLVDRRGEKALAFDTAVEPSDPKLVKEIERLLAEQPQGERK